jgi:hypothetical protein
VKLADFGFECYLTVFNVSQALQIIAGNEADKLCLSAFVTASAGLQPVVSRCLRAVRFCGLRQQPFREHAKSFFVTRILADEDGWLLPASHSPPSRNGGCQ